MILPTKYMHENKSLIKIGAQILLLLEDTSSVSLLWSKYKKLEMYQHDDPTINFDLFVAGLDFLYIINCIKFESGVVRKEIYD